MSDSTPPPMPLVTSMPIGDAFGRSFSVIFQNIGKAIRYALPAMIVYLVSIYFSFSYFSEFYSLMFSLDPGGPPEAVFEGFADVWIEMFVFSLLVYLVWVPTFTAWHRLVVFDGPDPSGRPLYRVGVSEVVYFLWIVGFFVITAVLTGILVAIGATLALVTPVLIALVAVAGPFILLYVLGRMSLVFPGVAMGGAYGIMRSWRATRGNAWKVFWAYFLIMMVIMIGTMVVQGAGGSVISAIYMQDLINEAQSGGQPDPAQVAAMMEIMMEAMLPLYLVLTPVTAFFSLLWISVVSLAYKYLVYDQSPERQGDVFS